MLGQLDYNILSTLKLNGFERNEIIAETWLRHSVKGLIERHQIDASTIQSLAYAVVIPEPGKPNLPRELVLEGGLPKTVEAQTLSSSCITSLRAVTAIADAIGDGRIDVGIAGGVDSFSQTVAFERILTRLVVVLPPTLTKDGTQDLGSCSNDAPHGAGDFRRADAAAVVYRNLRYSQAGPQGADLHLYGPAVRPIVHPQCREGIRANRAKGPKIGIPMPPE